MDISKYKVQLPYPTVCGRINERTYAKLMESYGGKSSETTAILQYSYQNVLLTNCNKELADALKGIAIVEMEHHELLAEAILTFGGDPILGGSCNYFNGSYINYAKEISCILYADIEGEKKAIEDYERIVHCSDNPSLVSLISRIILDEQLHIKILQEFYHCL